MQPVTLFDMKSRSLNQVIADNLKYFMGLDKSLYRNPNALSVATNKMVSPNTIRNLLYQGRRTTTTTKPIGYPTIDTLEILAKKLPGCETWMLLHPDLARIQRALRLEEVVEQRLASDKTDKQPA